MDVLRVLCLGQDIVPQYAALSPLKSAQPRACWPDNILHDVEHRTHLITCVTASFAAHCSPTAIDRMHIRYE